MCRSVRSPAALRQAPRQKQQGSKVGGTRTNGTRQNGTSVSWATLGLGLSSRTLPAGCQPVLKIQHRHFPQVSRKTQIEFSRETTLLTPLDVCSNGAGLAPSESSGGTPLLGQIFLNAFDHFFHRRGLG